MLNTKFDLYNTEWLDVVFDGRNKAYGAYDLRNHYAGTVNKAMVIAFTVVISAAVGLNFAFKTEPPTEIVNKPVIVDIKQIKIEEQKVVKPKPERQKVEAQPKVETKQYLSMVVTADKVAVKEPVKITDLKDAAIGPIDSKGDKPGEGINIPEPTENGGGGFAPTENNNEIVPFGGLEVNPEPYGGMAAFGKFLGRVLRFPGQAQDAGVSGRVIMSFVVEKNGEISNIKVERGAGFGFDEEATRVLKLAKAWKPGVQNGQPVRVRYTIPINFQLPAE